MFLEGIDQILRELSGTGFDEENEVMRVFRKLLQRAVDPLEECAWVWCDGDFLRRSVFRVGSESDACLGAFDEDGGAVVLACE